MAGVGIGIKKPIMWKHFVSNYFPITCCCSSTKLDCPRAKQNEWLLAATTIPQAASAPPITVRPDEFQTYHLCSSLQQQQKQLPRLEMTSSFHQQKLGHKDSVCSSATTDSSLSLSATSSKWAPPVRLSFVTVTVMSAVLLYVLGTMLFPNPTPIITMRDGQVQGKIAFSRDQREYWQFLSIPYAQAPLGKLRFEPPVPVEPWKGVKQARRFPPFCLQFESVITQTTFGVEDCLYINVFTHPFKKGDAKRPVLLHIAGGGFIAGGSRIYHPDYFMDHNLVVVTFNYRLGPFGFLNFEHDSVVDNVSLPRGNMGMKDQLLALKWVKNNIHSFGGDPNMVTLYGESAGGVSINLHVLSKQSRGLFHRAISHSGSGFSSWGFTTQPRKVALNYAKKWNCPTDNNSLLLDCIQQLDPYQMVRFQLSSTDPSLPKDSLSPSVESVVREDSFLLERPNDLMDKGNFPKIPYMFGVNSADGALRTGRFDALPYLVPAMKQNWTQMLGQVLLLDHLPYAVANQAREFYFGNVSHNYDSNFPEDAQKFKDVLTLLFSDVFAFEPVKRAAIGHAKTGATTRLFYYNYTPRVFPGVYSFFKACSPHDWVPCPINLAISLTVDWIGEHILGGKGAHQYGVSHAEEIFQLWNTEGLSKLFSGWELQFSKSFVKVIADFAQGSNDLQFYGTPWPSITTPTDFTNPNCTTPEPLPYMLLDNSGVGKVIPEPFGARLRFWESVGIKSFN